MRRRIIICLALLLSLCIIGDVIALFFIGGTIRQVTELAQAHHIQSLRKTLESSSLRVERDLLAAFGPHVPETFEPIDSLRRFEEAFGACGRCHHRPELQSGLDALSADFDLYRKTIHQMMGAGGVTALALTKETQKLARRIVGRATGMADRAADHLDVREGDVTASVRRAWSVLIGTMVAALLVGGLVAFHLKRRLTTPIEALLEGIDHIRQGDLNYHFSIEADREFRALGHAFNEANASLRTAHESILQAEKMAMVGKVAAGIAHEVGNPLASISSVAQMMKRRCDNDEQAEQLDLIMKHITRVSQIVRELLAFSRPANNNRRGPVEINEVLDSAVSLLRYDKRVGTTEVLKRYGPGLAIANGDSDRLLLVFTNIMMNAFDALAEGPTRSARLVISAVRQADVIVVRFEDNGPGMTAEAIRDAFEPFFTTKDPGAGTGLGLWICYQVVRRHGGVIRIDSQPNTGAAIIVELPQVVVD